MNSIAFELIDQAKQNIRTFNATSERMKTLEFSSEGFTTRVEENVKILFINKLKL